MDIANNTEYGLTGSLYSMRRDRLECARQEFHVGNLYLNRKCTHALVGVHPFGGFNMSGTDSKAGGSDYLAAVYAGEGCQRESLNRSHREMAALNLGGLAVGEAGGLRGPDVHLRRFSRSRNLWYTPSQ